MSETPLRTLKARSSAYRPLNKGERREPGSSSGPKPLEVKGWTPNYAARKKTRDSRRSCSRLRADPLINWQGRFNI